LAFYRQLVAKVVIKKEKTAFFYIFLFFSLSLTHIDGIQDILALLKD